MLKSGSYANYKNKEYKLLTKDENYRLGSYDKNDLLNGFTEDNSGMYIKKITLDDLDNAYSISTYCKYKGYDLQVVAYSKNDDIYEIECITAINSIPVEQLGFTFAERGVYRKRVKKDELDSIYEIKTPILGFE